MLSRFLTIGYEQKSTKYQPFYNGHYSCVDIGRRLRLREDRSGPGNEVEQIFDSYLSYYVMLMTKEIPLNNAFAVRLRSESSGLEVEARLGFNIDISSINALISTNKVLSSTE